MKQPRSFTSRLNLSTLTVLGAVSVFSTSAFAILPVVESRQPLPSSNGVNLHAEVGTQSSPNVVPSSSTDESTIASSEGGSAPAFEKMQVTQGQDASSATAEQDLSNNKQLMSQTIMELQGRLEVQEHQIQQLAKRQRELYLDLDRRLASLTGGQTHAAMAPSANLPTGNVGAVSAVEQTNQQAAQQDTQVPNIKPETLATESQQYQMAYQLLQHRQYTKAKDIFKKLTVEHPRGPYAPNAHYWLGEVYLLEGNAHAAEGEFTQVISQFPQHLKAADSLLKLGIMRMDTGKFDEAKQFFTQLRKRFPNSSSATLAGRKLRLIQQRS